MSRGLAVVCGIAAAACSADGQVFVQIPELPKAGSLILALHSEGGMELAALDLSQAARSVVFEAPSQRSALGLEALAYTSRLTDLGLTAGRLLRIEDGRSLPLEGRSVFSAQIEDGSFSGWVDQEAPSSALETFPAIPAQGCGHFRATPFSIDALGNVVFAFALDAESALIGTYDHHLYRVTAGAARPVDRFPPGLPFGAAVFVSQDEIWFAGDNTRIWRGRVLEIGGVFELDAQPVSTSSVPGEVRFMGSTDPGVPPFELYTLTASGALHHFQDDTIRLEHDFPMDSTKGGLVVLKRSSVLLGRSTQVGVFRLEDRQLVSDQPEGIEHGISGMNLWPQHGVLVGAGGGGGVFLRSLDGLWRSFPDSPLGLDIYSFAPTQLGFLAGSTSGRLAEHGLDGWCTPDQPGSGSIRFIVPLARGWVLAQDPPLTGESSSVTFYESISL